MIIDRNHRFNHRRSQKGVSGAVAPPPPLENIELIKYLSRFTPTLSRLESFNTTRCISSTFVNLNFVMSSPEKNPADTLELWSWS